MQYGIEDLFCMQWKARETPVCQAQVQYAIYTRSAEAPQVQHVNIARLAFNCGHWVGIISVG